MSVVRRAFLTLFLAIPFSLGAESALDSFIAALEPDRIFDSKAEMEAHYKELIESYQRKIVDAVCKETGVSRREIEEKHRAAIKGVQITGKPLSPELQEKADQEIELSKAQLNCKPAHPRVEKIAREVLEDFGLGEATLAIFSVPSARGCGAAVISRYETIFIGVDEQLMSLLSDHEIRATMAHEVQHVLFHDCAASDSVCGLACSNQLKLDYSRLCEIRADIFAAIKSPYYADIVEHVWSRYTYCQSWIEKVYGRIPDDYNTHPNPDQRVKVARIISRQLAAIPEMHPIDPRHEDFAKNKNEYHITWFLRRGVPYMATDIKAMAKWRMESWWWRTKNWWWQTKYAAKEKLRGWFGRKAAEQPVAAERIKAPSNTAHQSSSAPL